MILLEDVWKEYRTEFLRKRRTALRGVSLEVAPGEVFGFLGPNGAGKTTTIKLLLGLSRPTRGRVLLRGRDAADHRARAGVGFLPESPYFFGHLTGRELLVFFGRMAGLSGRKLAADVDATLELVGLSEAKNTLVRKYSKGMLQRAGIGQALLGDPELLILDEPMSGLDPIGRKEVRDLILMLRERGKTVFFSSHIIQDVEALCTRVGILVGGELRRVGALDRIMRREQDRLEVEVSGLDAGVLARIPVVTGVRSEGNRVKVSVDGEEYVRSVIDAIRDSGGTLESIIRRRETLEETFLREARPERRS